MSEKYFDESPETDLIHSRDYQSAAIGLLCSSLYLAMPVGTLRQPSFKEGKATVELLPPEEDEFITPFYSVGIIVHPGDDRVVEGEIMTTIQICQEMFPPEELLTDMEPARVDIIQEFRILWSKNKYLVQKERMLFDYDRGLSASLGDKSIADANEITALNELMDSWPIRAAEY